MPGILANQYARSIKGALTRRSLGSDFSFKASAQLSMSDSLPAKLGSAFVEVARGGSIFQDGVGLRHLQTCLCECATSCIEGRCDFWIFCSWGLPRMWTATMPLTATLLDRINVRPIGTDLLTWVEGDGYRTSSKQQTLLFHRSIDRGKWGTCNMCPLRMAQAS